jgi:hypothetical protein
MFKGFFDPFWTLILFLVQRRLKAEFLADAERRGLIGPSDTEKFDELLREAEASVAPPALPPPTTPPSRPALPGPTPHLNGEQPRRRGRPRKTPPPQPPDTHPDPDFADLVP